MIVGSWLNRILADPFKFPSSMLRNGTRLASDVANAFPFCHWQDPEPNIKGSAEIRILVDPREISREETRIWNCFITDIVRILCKNIEKSIQRNSLHSLQDPQQERFKSWQDRFVVICVGSTEETPYSLDKILVIRRAMILVNFLNES